jgi:predicted amidohydrolase
MEKFIVAAIQLNSQDKKEENLENMVAFIEEAINRGASLIAMPEMVNYLGPDIQENAEEIPYGVTFKTIAEQAKKHRVWIHCGSIAEKNSQDSRPYNTTMIINPQGELVVKYRKLHTFDVDIKDGPKVKESDRICPGDDIITIATQKVGHLGLSICYDIRFGEIFRLMALKGAQIFLAPANFTLNTGKDHWEPLLRARSIENSCYTIAPAQCGSKYQFHAYGKSMIIDPWGNVIAKASDKPCVITAEIDLEYLQSVRNQVFTLENRRTDVYTIKNKEK